MEIINTFLAFSAFFINVLEIAWYLLFPGSGMGRGGAPVLSPPEH